MAPYLVLAALLLGCLCFGKLRKLEDKSKDEPVLTEHAKVHAKSEHGQIRHIPSAKYIHFYVSERDTVVTCQVPTGVWEYLPKNDWGTLYHQGGTFFSFQRDCDGEIVSLETHGTIHDIYWRGR